MEQTPRATITKISQKRYSVTWAIPAVALVIMILLFIRWQLQQGPSITVTFSDVKGLTIDSPIMYRGAIVGRVEDIALSQENETVVVTVRLMQTATSLAVSGSTWWIVHPEVSLQGVNGLDTLIGPKYIQVSPGTGEVEHAFTGSDFAQQQNGKTFTIVTNSAEGITKGAPIFYRGIEIGHVHEITLASNASTVHLQFTVENIYTPIIRTNTVFWNASGLNFEASLTGFKLHAGPLASLVKGGLTLATPNNAGDIAPEGFAFNLVNDFDEDWLEWSPEIDLHGKAKEQ